MFVDVEDHRFVYLDCAATRPVEPEVIEAMAQESSGFPGNPASLHRLGRRATRRLEDLRGRFLDLLGCGGRGWNVVFTSGGTESDALGIVGTVAKFGGGAVVSDGLEHSAVLGCRPVIERMGGSMVLVDGDRTGRVSPDLMADAVTPGTILVSVMHTNNEIGTVQAVSEVARLARRANDRVWIHSDAVQALGHGDLSELVSSVDMFSLSAHKIGGPRGCGALVFREGRAPLALTGGGGQQEGVRSGTLDLPSIAGFVRALELERGGSLGNVEVLRDRLWDAIRDRIPGVERNGDGPFAPHILSVRLPGIGSEVLVRALSDRDVLASAGSACRSGAKGLSGTMRSLGLSEGWGVVRFSICRHTTGQQVDRAADVLAEVVDEYAL